MIHELIQSPGIISTYLAELRDVNVQKDRARFRQNLRRIGQCLALEISKYLPYHTTRTQTPLGVAEVQSLVSQPVLATILRAGLPMQEGVMQVFDWADHAFVSAYRKHEVGDDFSIQIDAVSAPSIEGRTLILSDPMLATGASMIQVCEQLMRQGRPAVIHVACAIASRYGVEEVKRALPAGTHIWAGAIDPDINEKGYIIPGLGDAGDLAFGLKLSK